MATHQRIEERSLAMHRIIARKIVADPELLRRALGNIERWLPGSGRSRPYLEAWREILARPLDEIARVIVEEGERMTAMRQNSPFAGVLTPKERWAIYREFKESAPDSR
jgi:hypothetical protein